MRISFFTYLVLLLSVVFISHQVNLQSAAVFFTALIVAIILSKLVSLGLNSESRQTTAKKNDQSAVLFGSRLFFVIFWGGLFSLIAYIILQRSKEILCPGFSSNIIGMIAMIILPLALMSVFSHRPGSKGASSVISWIAELLSGIIFVGGLVYYGLSHWLSTETAIAWWASGLLVAVLFSVVMAWAMSGKNKSVSLHIIWRSLSAGTNDFLRDFFITTGYYIGIIVAFRFLEAPETGIFILTMLFGELIWRLPLSFAGKADVKSELALASELGLNRLFSWALITTCIAVLGYLSISYGLLKDSAFQSWYLILIVVPGMIGFLFTRKLIRIFANARNNFLTIVVAVLIFTGHFDLSLIMLSKWGVIGVASAFSITFLISGGFLILFYKKKTKCDWRDIFKFSLKTPANALPDERGALV